jgi:glycerophosphoryl diester phosphodiesterase
MSSTSTFRRELVEELRAHAAALLLATLLWRCLSAFVVLPCGLLLLRAMLELSGQEVLADADLYGFALSPYGAGVLALLAALALGFALAGQALALLVFTAPSAAAPARVLSAFAALRAPLRSLLRLSGAVVLRCALIALPFALALLLVAKLCLGEHDINYYLAERPTELWVAVGSGGALLVLGGIAVAAQLAAWGLALPLLAYEGLDGRAALRASAEATRGHRQALFAQIVGLALTLAALGVAGSSAWIALGRAGLLRGGLTLEGLAWLAGLWLLLASAFEVAFGALRAACFAVLQRRWHRSLRPTARIATQPLVLSRRSPGILALGLLAAAALSLVLGALALLEVAPPERCVVIAHRGASQVAPENTLAAVRAAIDARAELVEIDVQETRDGVVVVLHDRDLLRVGGVPLAVASTTADELRAVDLGARFDPRFRGERVPTLDEVLALARGRIHVLIELKRYAPGGRLPERVVERIESAGLTDGFSLMSMDPELVRRLRELRPEWRVGALSAVSLGRLARVDAAFVAVRASRVSAAFVRDAHRRGKQVYVWTVNEPLEIARAFAFGVDGVITDRPELAVALRTAKAELDDFERVLAALAARLGAPLTPPPVVDEEGPAEEP